MSDEPRHETTETAIAVCMAKLAEFARISPTAANIRAGMSGFFTAWATEHLTDERPVRVYLKIQVDEPGAAGAVLTEEFVSHRAPSTPDAAISGQPILPKSQRQLKGSTDARE